jgi:hypothetical protein
MMKWPAGCSIIAVVTDASRIMMASGKACSSASASLVGEFQRTSGFISRFGSDQAPPSVLVMNRTGTTLTVAQEGTSPVAGS